jgi:hypothetical protein
MLDAQGCPLVVNTTLRALLEICATQAEELEALRAELVAVGVLPPEPEPEGGQPAQA